MCDDTGDVFVHTFPTEGFIPRTGCTTASDFVQTAAFGQTFLPTAGTVSLTLARAHGLTVLTALLATRIPAEHLDIHVRLDARDGGTINVDALCCFIMLHGPCFRNMSMTIPRTLDKDKFCDLLIVWQKMLVLRSRGDDKLHASPASTSGDDEQRVVSKSVVRLSNAERKQRCKRAGSFFRTRWLSDQEILSGEGQLESFEQFLQLINTGWSDVRCSVADLTILSQMAACLQKTPLSTKLHVVVRCHGKMLRSFHHMLALLWPHTASLWLVMTDHSVNDLALEDLMTCNGFCSHPPLDHGHCSLFLTGISLARCSRLSDAAMPLLENVERVNVNFCEQLTYAGFSHLRHCTDVSARYTAVSDDIVHLFADTTTLDITGCPVSPEMMIVLRDVQAVNAMFQSVEDVDECVNLCC